MMPNPAGAPPLDWWSISPGGYEGAHYAVFPPDLLVRPIKAMCPLRVCEVCGKASERITETTQLGTGRTTNGPKMATGYNVEHQRKDFKTRTVSRSETLGWTDCGHNSWRAGRVLDPFGGSGTTAMVTTGHGRDCLSIDLDARNSDLAYERVGGLVFKDVNVSELPSLLGRKATEEAA